MTNYNNLMTCKLYDIYSQQQDGFSTLAIHYRKRG
jgi:hypothetical protein